MPKKRDSKGRFVPGHSRPDRVECLDGTMLYVEEGEGIMDDLLKIQVGNGENKKVFYADEMLLENLRKKAEGASSD